MSNSEQLHSVTNKNSYVFESLHVSVELESNIFETHVMHDLANTNLRKEGNRQTGGFKNARERYINEKISYSI